MEGRKFCVSICPSVPPSIHLLRRAKEGEVPIRFIKRRAHTLMYGILLSPVPRDLNGPCKTKFPRALLKAKFPVPVLFLFPLVLLPLLLSSVHPEKATYPQTSAECTPGGGATWLADTSLSAESVPSTPATTDQRQTRNAEQNVEQKSCGMTCLWDY